MTSTINTFWKDFKFYQEFDVRYGDLDTQCHVNNIKYLEYIETARIGYYQAAGIWDGTVRVGGFGMVIASVKIDFLDSLHFGDRFRVGTKITHIGRKSMTFAFVIESLDGKTTYSRGEVISVAYNSHLGQSTIVPKIWREKLAEYENNKDLL